MQSNNKSTVSNANMESNTSNESLAKEKAKRFDSPVNIHVISYRKFNHDPDGISVKAVLDGIVRTGILTDDSTKQVKKISFESIKSKEEEETIIEITEI